MTLLITHLETFFYAKRDDSLVGPDGAPVDVGRSFRPDSECCLGRSSETDPGGVSGSLPFRI